MGLGFGFAFIFFMISLSLVLDGSSQSGLIWLYVFFGFLFGYILNLKNQLKRVIKDNNQIQESLYQLKVSINQLKNQSKTPLETPEIITEKAQPSPISQAHSKVTAHEADNENQKPQLIPPKEKIQPAFLDDDWVEQTKQPRSRPRPIPQKERIYEQNTPTPPNFIQIIMQKAIDWLNDGNLFVRIGIILFFMGASFLIKLGIDNNVISIEFRLIGLSLAAIGLLRFGWQQRLLRAKYALLLQGAAIGILYITIFGAFRTYHLLPASLAFFLLFSVSMFTASLAVLQNAPSLAFFGFLGGFAAPILASTNSGNHVALFSYYAVLNTAIFAVAWFKSWRLLNILGFVCTYVIGIAWGVLKYNPSQFASTEPFVLLFFAFYIGIALLYAVKQPPELKGYVDTTLLFGVPAVTFGIQIALVKPFEYGIAISSFCFGIIYIGLGRLIWSQGGENFKLLAQVFLALAMVFVSLAIPFAFDASTTAGAWALEGAVVFWVGCQQKRTFSRIFGLLLQFGAGIFLLNGWPYQENIIFLNANYIGVLMLVVAGLISLYHLNKNPHLFQILHPVFHLWISSWWILGGLYQLVYHLNYQQMPLGLIAYTALSLFLIFKLIQRFADPKTGYGHYYLNNLLAIFPLIWILSGLIFSFDYLYPIHKNGLFILLFAFISGYVFVYACENFAKAFFLQWAHFILVSGLFLMIEWQWIWWSTETWALTKAWLWTSTILPLLGGLFVLTNLNFWPLRPWKMVYNGLFAKILALLTLIWIFISFYHSGEASPLPWIPIINPLDIVNIIAVALLFQSKIIIHSKNKLKMIFKLFLFISANVMLLRILHHWNGIPYNAHALFHSNLVQTSLSVFWTISGFMAILYASSHQSRRLWIAACSLLGLVVFKLFVIDFDAHNSVERIISFMFVGAVFMGIGYFAPIPPTKKGINNEK